LLALIGIGVYWFLSRRRTTAPVKPVRPTVASTPPQPAIRAESGGAAAFCTQCGHTLRSDDRFCPQCGTPRKG
jgi:hypothetical protein